MKSGSGRSTAVVAVAWALAAGTSACGDREPEFTASDALAALFAAVAEDSVATLVTGDTVHVSAATASFYDGRGRAVAWSEKRELSEQGRSVHDAIGRAREDGLSPQRYRHDIAAQLLAALEPEERRDRLPDSLAVHYLAALDVLLTEGFNRFASDLVTGTLDPAEAGLDWRISTEIAREDVVLNNLLAGMSTDEVVAYLRPSIPYYERMRTALAHYHAAEARGGWPQIPAGESLKEGVRADAVALLRQRLVLGTDEREASLARAGEADPSFFDAQLAEAVQHFQQRHSIDPDGAVGSATLKELNHTVEERIAEMRLNLDRWRWLPNELGDRFVIVNVAGFEMEVVDGGRTIESMNVVVGRRDRQTPIFADSIQFVVVNPYWNVPPNIFRKDVLPAMQRDPSYLARNDMEMVDGRVRQRPGPRNSLGRFKFIFPNDYDVYLHDTPQGSLFSRTRRDFSSGCIRIERPEEFARLLLDLQSEAGSSQLDRHLTHWNERWIKLDRPLPVYLLYFTAWVEEDGTVRFHHDVYGRDEKLESQVEERMEPAPPPQQRRVATGGGA